MDLITLANNGDINARNILSDMYARESYPTDINLDNQSAYGLCNMGYVYLSKLSSSGNEEYIAKARESFEKSGCPEAQAMLSIFMQTTEDIETCLQKAMKHGNSTAYWLMGKQKVNAKDFNNAKKYFKSAVKCGHTCAMSELGGIYEDSGQFEKAEKCYKVGVARNNSHCMFNLATMHKNRETESEETIKKLLTKSAALGNVRAMVTLGVMSNAHDAKMWYKKAGNDPKALFNLAMLYKRGMLGLEDDSDNEYEPNVYTESDAYDLALKKKIIPLLQKSAKQGEFQSILTLSRMGVAEDATEHDIENMFTMKKMFGHFGAWDVDF